MFITSTISCEANNTLAPTGRMTTARAAHTATLLSDGKVLIAGGMERNDVHTNSAELYDPVTGRFVITGNMNVKRSGHTATRLSNGKILI
ncbi:MAG: kelch repeat-containing protein, partial [Acidobacteriota bacterium]|nr:kelch repeat-containing protein [Acidobacteriota bacterium]